MSNDKSWQLAFWVITIICGTWLLTLTTNVVANDRLRASEDIRISGKIEVLMEKNNADHEFIKISLAKIQSLLKQEDK